MSRGCTPPDGPLGRARALGRRRARFSHIGVIEELQAAGVQIDRVGGTSMGAFLGALLAQGIDAAEIDACCYREFVRRNPFDDYRLPRISLVRGDRARAMLERNLPGAIEDLPRAFFCVSVDLIAPSSSTTGGDRSRSRSARAWRFRSSPPVAFDQQLLVDGAPDGQPADRGHGGDARARSSPPTSPSPRPGAPRWDGAQRPDADGDGLEVILLARVPPRPAAPFADVLVRPDDEGSASSSSTCSTACARPGPGGGRRAGRCAAVGVRLTGRGRGTSSLRSAGDAVLACHDRRRERHPMVLGPGRPDRRPRPEQDLVGPLGQPAGRAGLDVLGVVRRRLARLAHLLPPRLGGPLALLEEAPDAAIVVCGHVGLDGLHSLREIWSGALVGSTVHVRFWRHERSEVPAARDEQAAWLYDRWQELDDWVAAQHASTPAAAAAVAV